jgi:hypothetical protein
MGIDVVKGESAVGVPLRLLFRYEWMDVSHIINPISPFSTGSVY